MLPLVVTPCSVAEPLVIDSALRAVVAPAGPKVTLPPAPPPSATVSMVSTKPPSTARPAKSIAPAGALPPAGSVSISRSPPRVTSLTPAKLTAAPLVSHWPEMVSGPPRTDRV